MFKKIFVLGFLIANCFLDEFPDVFFLNVKMSKHDAVTYGDINAKHKLLKHKC